MNVDDINDKVILEYIAEGLYQADKRESANVRKLEKRGLPVADTWVRLNDIFNLRCIVAEKIFRLYMADSYGIYSADASPVMDNVG